MNSEANEKADLFLRHALKPRETEATMRDEQPFRNAVQSGDMDAVRKLLEEQPALASTRDERGGSLILGAVFARRMEIAELLASQRADLDVFEAAALGRVERVRRILNEDESQATAFGADGFTALHYAAHLGHLEIVERLVAGGADLQAVARNPIAVMPLQSAVAGGQVAIARFLLDQGASVNARQEQAGTTVLHVAAFAGNTEMVALLLENGAEVNARQTSDAKTPLAMAEANGHAAVVELLRARGAECSR
jgi:ankyrin repeat protein